MKRNQANKMYLLPHMCKNATMYKETVPRITGTDTRNNEPNKKPDKKHAKEDSNKQNNQSAHAKHPKNSPI